VKLLVAANSTADSVDNATSFDSQAAGRRPTWTLTRPALDRLLAALDRDPEAAAIAYEELRARVIGLLQWWRAAEPEELADRTLDRVARKLEEGAVIPEGSLGAYIRGVARMVYYEAARDVQRRQPAAADVPSHLTLVHTRTDETSHACLDRCLSMLTAAERSLVLRYYSDGKTDDVRRRLAAELGISSTALRIRTHRLRERLERCMKGCLDER
jgi:DNA-directed RNA polymerase specialized sigma24 family protein